MFSDRNYMIFSTSELNKIDFEQVLETSADTVRKSTNGSLTFVKWEGTQPQCLSTLTTAEGPYTHAEIIAILSSEPWTTSLAEP